MVFVLTRSSVIPNVNEVELSKGRHNDSRVSHNSQVGSWGLRVFLLDSVSSVLHNVTFCG